MKIPRRHLGQDMGHIIGGIMVRQQLAKQREQFSPCPSCGRQRDEDNDCISCEKIIHDADQE